MSNAYYRIARPENDAFRGYLNGLRAKGKGVIACGDLNAESAKKQGETYGITISGSCQAIACWSGRVAGKSAATGVLL